MNPPLIARRLPQVIAAVMVIMFGVLSYRAVRQKSPTIDEPICSLSGYLYIHDGDLRYDVDNPPLWKYWAMIPNFRTNLAPATAPAGSSGSDNDFAVATRRLFQTPGNDGISFVNRSRAMMLVVGIALAVALTAWTWQLGGATTAIIACALFCFDPNFLAHSPLMKADVAIALLMLCIAWSAWSIGRTGRTRNILVFALLCAAAVTVKYNGVMLALVGPMLLMCRALTSQPWIVLGRRIERRAGRLGASLAITSVTVVVCWLSIWACYQFRYEPSPDGAGLNIAAEVEHLKRERFILTHEIAPTTQQLSEVRAPLVARVAMFCDEHRLLPQAWLFGFVSIYRSSTTMIRQSYLLGDVSMTGWWYYYPLAMLFKTPLATLAAIGLACAVPFTCRKAPTSSKVESWTILCLAGPALLYALSALLSSANAGVRHVLPLYPPIMIGVGIAAARLKSNRPRFFWMAAGVLGIGLAAESLVAFPHYLSFFNAPSRSNRLHLLSDSNFDWGQDLSAVARWQKANPSTPLYLAYWGPADPHFYGIRYTNLPGGFALGYEDIPLDMGRPGAIMVSATLLQGVNQPTSIRDYYAPLRDRSPDGMIGDSIYLFNWSPR